MQIKELIVNKALLVGIHDRLTDEEKSKQKLVNIFIWTSILFCIPYYIVFIFASQFQLASLFIITQLLFIFSLVASRNGYLNTSKILIIITTNYAILSLNLYFGKDAGFLLYYFAAPLVIFTLFHYRQKKQVIFGLFFYFSSYLIAEIINEKGALPLIEVDALTKTWMHSLNTVMAFSYLVFLAFGFAKEHYESYEKLTNQHNFLERILREKNTLLSETHHRVKNNMAVISGLLDLQMMYNNQPELKQLLTSSKSRIKSMSLVHESLYSQKDVGEIDFKEYISKVVQEIESSHKKETKVVVHLAIDKMNFDLQKAVPLGLIINELITNAYKHAFLGSSQGAIFLDFKKEENYTLIVRDNGIGMSEDKNDTMGLSLIHALVKQIDGSYQFSSNAGTIFKMTFA